MLVDTLLQHEVEGWVDRLVEGVEELESKRAELVDKLEDDRNVNVGNGRNGCSYKEFVACKDISGCGDNQKVKYSTGSLTGSTLTWWNSEVRTKGHEAVVGMTWENFKALMKGEYCSSNKMQRLETEFWSHSMVGAGHSAYTDRFHKFARLVPHLVTFETKRIERYICGLAPQIRKMVAATELPTIQNAILKAEVLTDEAVKNGSLKRIGETRGDGGCNTPKIQYATEQQLGVLLHSPYTHVTENDCKRDFLKQVSHSIY
uniref:Reverse transcriptase domain-containing protein n=1 Tax=Tanacetum cinerariifolium TaxID=118510 RepID=A0A699IWZ9_TANCI|nr:reverse transcriptase domain-containing protein [Tanacetum cinerariifolium]